MISDNEIENFIYEEIKKHWNSIKKYSNQFDVDIKLITALIYVERIQYKLDSIRKFAKDIKNGIEELVKIFVDNEDVAYFFNSSKGFSHVKFGTGQAVVRNYASSEITDLDLGIFAYDPENNADLSIKFACAIVKQHILMWQHEVPDIKDRIDILATLYNISDFENKKPHSDPKSGGSILPNIVDECYIEGICFGDRVKAVYNSKKMQDFLNKI